MKRLLLICCIIFSNLCFSQQSKMIEKHRTYNTLLTKGFIEYYKRNLTDAIEYFDSASVVFAHFHKPYYQLIVCHAELGDYENAYNNSLKMASTGMRFTIAGGIDKYMNSAWHKKFLDEEDSLLRIAIKDTAYYNAIIKVAEFGGNHFEKFQKLVKLSSERGFPTYNKVGFYAYRKAYGMCRNAVSFYPSAEWKTLLPILQSEEEKGNIEVGACCLLEDTNLRKQEEMTKYGIYYLYDKNIPLPPLEELNKNRANAGLEDFELFKELADLMPR